MTCAEPDAQARECIDFPRLRVGLSRIQMSPKRKRGRLFLPRLRVGLRGSDMYNDEFPLAYFITWTTYGAWLPGDERGWCKRGSRVVEEPDIQLAGIAYQAMAEEPVVLTQAQRDLVDL